MPSRAQKYVTHNGGPQLLDAVAQPTIAGLVAARQQAQPKAPAT
jgi:hypothetical protein